MSAAHTPGKLLPVPAGSVMAGYSQSHALASPEHNTLIAGLFSDVKGGSEVAAANAARLARCWNTNDKLVQALCAIANHSNDAFALKVARDVLKSIDVKP